MTPLEIAGQTQASKPVFEWPNDQPELAVANDQNVKRIQAEYFTGWGVFWLMSWLGTTITGALFGGALGLLGINCDPSIPLLGLVLGGLWTGGVGLFVFAHLAAICWTCWRLGRPLLIASIAGIFTGAICGQVFFFVVTVPLGATGAYLGGSLFLKSATGKQFLANIKAVQDQSLGPLAFTVKDLLLRVTVLAVFIAGWTAVVGIVLGFAEV